MLDNSKIERIYNKVYEISEGEDSPVVVCALITVLANIVLEAHNRGAVPASEYMEAINNQLESIVENKMTRVNEVH